LPYRFVVAGAAPQSGQCAANLNNQSRWWVSSHKKAGPEIDAGSGSADASGLDMSGIMESTAPTGVPEGLFKMNKPPEGWKLAVTGGAVVPVAEAGTLPTRGSSALAATRFMAAAEGAAVIRVAYPGPRPGTKPGVEELPPALTVQVWLNEKVVFNSQTHYAESVKRRQPKLPALSAVRLRAGANTLVVGCASDVDGAAVADGVGVTFLDAKTDKPIASLILDMEGVKK
jgi:hypothetical protein